MKDKLMKSHRVKDKREKEGREREDVFGEDEGVRAGSVHNYIFCSEQYWESIM